MLGTKLEETRVVRDAIDEGAMRHAQSFVLRLLSRKFEVVPDRVLAQINTLTIEQLDSLGESLLDFASIDDLTAWLKGY